MKFRYLISSFKNPRDQKLIQKLPKCDNQFRIPETKNYFQYNKVFKLLFSINKVYPEALSLMPFPWFWCIMFFLMMILIGGGSILSYMECVLDSSTEMFKYFLKTKRHESLFRLGACVLFFLIGMSMTTRVNKKSDTFFFIDL
jgi:SNF family Na+-dependent transporter